MKKTIVELCNVDFSRNDQRILHNLNLRVNDGEFIVIIGPNGSGKSTLLKMLNGMLRPDAGEIFIHEKSIVHQPTHVIARNVVTLTQDLQLSTFSDLTVNENLQLARAARGLAVDGKTYNAMLMEKGDVVAGSLSGGQRQALALAMCFVSIPQLLLLDEHTSALDPKAAKTLMKYTNDQITQHSVTALMVTHNLEHALAYGNRLIALRDGEISADLNDEAKKKITMKELFELAY